MILVRLLGGLGNQMFQYAYGKQLAHRFNDRVLLDLGAYETYKVRSFEMERLSIPNLSIMPEELAQTANYRRIRLAQKEYHVLQKLIRMGRRDDYLGKDLFNFFAKRGLYFNFDSYYYESPVSNVSLKSVYGYFQGESYFQDVKDEICQEFKVSSPIEETEGALLKEINSCYAVGVSVRCGHRYKGTLLDVCDEHYFAEGMKLIKASHSDSRFFLFSDDVEYVKKHYSLPFEVKYVEGFSPTQSLRLLYSCDGFVISNSTFSWWGAYLSESEDKMTVAPQIWRKKSYAVPDIYSCGFDILL